MKVKAAMHHGVEWCAPDTPLTEIAKIMKMEDIGAVPIGDNDRLIGMVTDRDIACKVVAEGRDISSATARDAMTEGIYYCREDEDVGKAVQRMEDKRIRRLPVINKAKRMVGMLSLGDLSHMAPAKFSTEALKAVSAHHATHH